MNRRYHLEPREIDAQVLTFSEALKPCQWLQEEGQLAANNVFNVLKRESQIKVLTLRYSGSCEKGTGVIEPDFDFVVVVDVDVTERKVFTKVLEDFNRVLNVRCGELGIIKSSLRYFAGVNVLKFTLKSGLELDILPASCKNANEILHIIGAMENPTRGWKSLSNSLMKEQVAFVKSFKSAHPLIRIAKLWMKSLHVLKTGKVLGGMTIAELVAIATYLTGNSGSIIQSFLHFLDMMINLRNLKVAFRKNFPGGNWSLVDRSSLDNGDASLVPEVLGTLSMLERSCFIIDPANPYNDLLQDQDSISPNLTLVLMRCARVTKNRISAMLSGAYIRKDGCINFSKLLKPQPYSLENLYRAGVPEFARIHYSFRGCPTKYSRVTEIKPGFYKNEGRLIVNALRTDIIQLVNAIKISVEQFEESDGYIARKAIKTCVKNMVKTRLPSVTLLQSSHPRKHLDMDLILDVPYSVNGCHYAVRMSFEWEKQN